MMKNKITRTHTIGREIATDRKIGERWEREGLEKGREGVYDYRK